MIEFSSKEHDFDTRLKRQKQKICESAKIIANATLQRFFIRKVKPVDHYYYYYYYYYYTTPPKYFILSVVD